MLAFMACPTSNASACELAATIMLSLALLPEAPNAAVEEGLLAPLVKVRCLLFSLLSLLILQKG